MEQSLQRRPDTPSVRVLDLGWQGLLNPNPLSREEDETLVDEYLSPSRLKALTGEDNLQEVTTLQMCVDTRERTLGNFGTHMPNLRELKLNNSVIMSIRDLGTSLSHLQVLWMARCSLTDLDGISSFSSLKELYLAYNDLKDLSQVSMLENLEILDLEGNNLDKVSELQYLALCSKLTTLTLEGNPICSRPSPEDTESSDYNYRVEVKRLIPQLQYLDDVPADQRNPNTPRTPNQDWLMVLDSLKESALSLASVDLGRAQRKPSMRPSTAQPVLTRRPHSAPRASSAGRIVSSLPSAEPSDDSPVEDEASDLTHGVSKVICGNPIKALRARKERLEATHVSSVPPTGFKPEVSFDSVTVSQRDRDDVFAELKAWREMHHEVLQRIKDERAPQVLTISHSDEEDTDSFSSSSEDEDLDEDLEDTWDSGCLVRVSPETSMHSPRSPTAIPLNAGELMSPDSPRQPSPPMTPCPPGSIGVNSRPNKGADIRARRLLRVYTPSKTTALRAMPTDTCMGDEDFLPTDIDDKIIRTQLMIQQTSKPVGELNRRSSSGPGQLENNNSRPTLARFISSHQPVIRSSIKTPERPSPPQIIRPVTATGILQRLPNRPTLLTASKSSST